MYVLRGALYCCIYHCDILGGVIMVLSSRSILSYFCTAIRHVALLAITGAILSVLYISS